MKGGFLLSDASRQLIDLPEPYRNWSDNCIDESTCSVLNHTGHSGPINAQITRALLAYASGSQSPIAAVKLKDGTYACEQTIATDPVPTYRVATASANRLLLAAKLTASMDAGQETFIEDSIPNIGSRKHAVDCTQFLLLLMLIRADQTKAANIQAKAVTWELLNAARDAVSSGRTVPEQIVRLVNDDLKMLIDQPDGPFSVNDGMIGKFRYENIKNGAYSTSEVVCGSPVLLTPQSAAVVTEFTECTIAQAKAMVKPYTDTLSWTADEEFLIPDFPDDAVVPAEVMEILGRFLSTRNTKRPLTNPCWRGTTGFGKSYGVKMLACILHTPLVFMTCSSSTEKEDFLAKMIPNTGNDQEATQSPVPSATVAQTMQELPDFETVVYDPAAAYRMLTGRENPEVTTQEVSRLYMKAALDRELQKVNSSVNGTNDDKPFKVVDSDFITALARGWICEVQEFSRIRDAGVLVGLNNLSDVGGVITLVDGRHVRRHPDAIIMWTDNVGLASCRKVDASVLRRFSYVIDSDELSMDRAIERTQQNIGFENKEMLERMYAVWQKIKQYCSDNDVTDEGVCSLPDLEAWALLVKLDRYRNVELNCKRTIVSKLSSDPETQAEIMDNAVKPALRDKQLYT